MKWRLAVLAVLALGLALWTFQPAPTEHETTRPTVLETARRKPMKVPVFRSEAAPRRPVVAAPRERPPEASPGGSWRTFRCDFDGVLAEERPLLQGWGPGGPLMTRAEIVAGQVSFFAPAETWSVALEGMGEVETLDGHCVGALQAHDAVVDVLTEPEAMIQADCGDTPRFAVADEHGNASLGVVAGRCRISVMLESGEVSSPEPVVVSMAVGDVYEVDLRQLAAAGLPQREL